MKKIVYILSIVIVGCSSSSTDQEIISEKTTEIIADTTITDSVNNLKRAAKTTDFNTFYNNFVTAITNNDTASFNSFILKDYGLHFIEAPGAMPMFVKIYAI